MEITWYGQSCFRMVERGVATIMTDPFDDSIGYAPLKREADIVTVSHDAPGHNALTAVKGARHLLTHPGEYEIGGVFITGIVTYHHDANPRPNNVFVYNFEALSVCHLGDLDYLPDQSQIEALGPIDVLLVPVGGGSALNAAQAAEVISLIEPSVVIPMHYQTPACRLPLEPVDKFLKEMGLSAVEPVESLTIRSASSAEDTRVVVLTYEH